jgi:hypothetical protein
VGVGGGVGASGGESGMVRALTEGGGGFTEGTSDWTSSKNK